MNVKKLKKQEIPLNFKKVTTTLRKDLTVVKLVTVEKLMTNQQHVNICFHPISRII